MNRGLRSVAAAGALALLGTAAVAAKSPGVEASLDPIVAPVRAGDLTPLGVTLRDQNGDPVLARSVSFTLRQAGTGQTVTAAAVPDSTVGHYVAKLTIPAEGGWLVQVSAKGAQMETQFDLDLLQVRPPVAAPAATPASLPAGVWLVAIAALGVVGAAGILGVRTSRRGKRQRAPRIAG